MRTLILADVHANLEALDAVLWEADRLHVDDLVVLGDVVGYNASPSAVIQRIRGLVPTLMVRGNHDKVCADLEPSSAFNATARLAIEWTRQQLSPEELEWLAALPQGSLVWEASGYSLECCHGAPFDEDFYVTDTRDARRAFEQMGTSLCLNGHTHVPVVFRTAGFAVTQDLPDTAYPTLRQIEWPATGKMLVNVGSVGQPRDGDPRAAFGVWDSGRGVLELRRVPYDIVATQQRILLAGLPQPLALRLASGD